MQTGQKIGFIGQGYVGKSYADNFESRGFSVVRYSLEEEYKGGKAQINECKVIFIAVPTPTRSNGFDDSIVRSVLAEISPATIVVIKSTLSPGTTEVIQSDFPNLTILYSPEFLSESTAAKDVANPFANIVGIPIEDPTHRYAADQLLILLPTAKEEIICTASEAELIKYAHNTLGYTKVVFVNLLFEVAEKMGADWATIRKALASDPMVAPYHLDPFHKGGRGAGGRCQIKDFESFTRLYGTLVDDPLGNQVLASLKRKNVDLLTKSSKNLEILKDVYKR